MITSQKPAGVFGDSYEFPHLLTYSVELFYPNKSYNIHHSYNQYIYPTETLVPRQGRIPKPKPIQYFLGVYRNGFPREIVTQPISSSEATGKEEEHIDNRYDYTLHAMQDDKHHDNARTN